MKRSFVACFAAGCLAWGACSETAHAQQCGPGGQGGGGQAGSPGMQQAFAMQGQMGMQGPSQRGFSQQQMAQTLTQLQAPQAAAAQIAANRRQERFQEAQYRAMIAQRNKERFQASAEAERLRRNEYRERNRQRMLAQGQN